jgi:dienelactone hydrolase
MKKNGMTVFLSATLLCLAAQITFAQHDTTLHLSHTLVTVYYPKAPIRGTILMLPGWNFSKDKTCANSSFCDKALKQGYVLVCPDMGKSLYASARFSNTRSDWAAYPQLSFVTDTLLPVLQTQFKLLVPGQKNFLYGISTGARGGCLILEATGKLFEAAALLSGDYDQCLDTRDNLMNGYYGSYSEFKERWEGVDNPARHINKLEVPILLGHGQSDKVVPFVQSESLAALLKKKGHVVETAFPANKGHSYDFWGSETDAVLLFFGKRF